MLKQSTISKWIKMLYIIQKQYNSLNIIWSAKQGYFI